MTPKEFITLLREIKDIPFVDLKVQFIEKRFKELKYSKETVHKTFKYYLDELQNAFNSTDTIFKGKVIKQPDHWGIVGDLPGNPYYSAYFKVSYKGWKNLKELVLLLDRNQPPPKNIQTFVSLFRNTDNAKKVKDILEIKGYTKNNKWQGLNGNKTELLAAYYSLHEKHGIMRPGKTTPQAKLFYNEFGLSVPGYISERSLTTPPNSEHINEFNTLFDKIK